MIFLVFFLVSNVYGTLGAMDRYKDDKVEDCCQTSPKIPSLSGIKVVSVDDRLLPVICPSPDIKLSLFQCSVGQQCHCNLTLTTYFLCFGDLECCDELESCTDCTFTYKCHDVLHGYCPHHVFPTAPTPHAQHEVNVPLAVFVTSLLCLIVATICVYVYKQRRRYLRRRDIDGGKHSIYSMVIKYFTKKST